MNAILIIPPKFFAVFSKREKMRRDSLSQPISRSMMLRRRYCSPSNFTMRASRSSLSLHGITGSIWEKKADTLLFCASYSYAQVSYPCFCVHLIRETLGKMDRLIHIIAIIGGQLPRSHVSISSAVCRQTRNSTSVPVSPCIEPHNCFCLFPSYCRSSSPSGVSA